MGQPMAALAARASGAVMAVVVAAGCGATAAERRYDDMLAESSRWPAFASDDGAGLFAGDAELDRAELVRAVLARNPDVESARQAWRATLAEVRQASALEDPMLSYGLAPLSVGGDAPFGQRVELSQKLPWPGKRRLAGEAAIAEAEAMKGELDSVRLELALMASNLYEDFYTIARSLEVNQHHHDLVVQFKKAAEAQYVTGKASQQDPLQAEVELAQLERERIVLEAQRASVVAEMNGLLRRDPAAALPPPPAEQAARQAPPIDSRQLAEEALAARPELRTQEARLRGARAEIGAARREYYPDIELMGSYDSMWDMPEHRWMVGIGLDIPIQLGRRRAAVDRAEAMSARARSGDDKLRAAIRVEVEQAALRIREGDELVRIVAERLLPAARDQVEAARAGFVTGKNEFVALIMAENNLRRVELELHQARAELARRLAVLDRAVGRIPGLEKGDVK
jgi:outer membrane protein, heavy metal efflux system